MTSIFKSKKYMFISIFVVAIISLTIGYAFITEKLSVNGTTQISQNNWIIYFDNIVENDSNVSTSNPAAIILPDKVKVDFNVELDKTQDAYEFTVDMVNDGTIDAQIDSIEKSALTLEELKNLEYTITYGDGTPIKPCDVLAANSRREIVVRVRLKENEKYLTIEEQNLDLSFEMNYLQYDSNKVCDNEENSYTLTIDPDGGIYDGSTELVVINNLSNGTKVKLVDVPTREDYYFKGWELYNNDDYITNYEEEINTVTILGKNAYLKALWGQEIGPHTLFIDPNGGVYNGTTDVTVKANLPSGRVINLGTNPTKDGLLFKRWVPTNTVDYNTNYNVRNNTVIIEDRDAYITAEYGEPVARINDTYYASLQNAFDDSVPGDTIYLLVDTEENPVNYLKLDRGSNVETVTLDLGGHKVTGTITNNDFLTIINGTIENLDGVGAVNNGTLTIGIDDGTVLVDEEGTIAIIGSSTEGKGLENHGTFNFYDGYLEAKVGLTGGYNNIPEDWYVYVNHNDVKNCQKVHLTQDVSRAVAKTTYEGVDTRYFNLQDALNSGMLDSLNVYAIRDFEAAYELNVPENEEVLFDLAGFVVNTGNNIINNGKFTITDTGRTVNSENQKGELNLSKTITNFGNLLLSDITINSKNDINTLTNNGVINLTNANINAVSGYALTTTGVGDTYADSSTNFFSSNNYAILVPTDFTLSITGGNVRGVWNKGNFIMNDGTYISSYNQNNDSVGVNNNHDNGKTSNFTMNGGTINVEGTTRYNYGIVVSTSGSSNIEINGGILNVTSTYWASPDVFGIYGRNNVNVIINDIEMTVTSTRGGINGVNNNSVNTINGGTFNVTGVSPTAFSEGTYNVNGGVINVSGSSGANAFNAKVIIEEGVEITSSHVCINSRYGGATELNGGILNCGTVGINNDSVTDMFKMTSGTVTANDVALSLNRGGTITGGTLKSLNKNGISFNGLYQNRLLNLDVSNATIEGYLSGISVNNGTMSVNDSTIEGKTEYGIYYANGTLTLGVDDESISDLQRIKGVSYGVYSTNGLINIFDGKYYGGVSGISGLISTTPDGYEVVTEDTEDENTKVSYLKVADYVAQVGSNKYTSLKQAVDSIEETGTVEILKSFSLTTSVVIPEEKNITIDLNNNQIEAFKSITNDGKLTFKDSGTEGKIYFRYGNCFVNNSDFTIESGTYDSETGDNSTTYLVCNNKNFELKGGLLAITEENRKRPNRFYFIYNATKESYVKISGGKIKSDYLANVTGVGNIGGSYNASTINMSDGEIDISSTSGTGSSTALESQNVYLSGGKISVDGHQVTGIAAGYCEISDGEINVRGNYSVTGVNVDTDYWSGFKITGGKITSSLGSSPRNGYSIVGVSGAGSISNNPIINSDGTCLSKRVSNSDLVIDSGTFTCGGVGMSFGNRNVIINDVTVTSVSNAVEVSSGSATINGGTFTSTSAGGIVIGGATVTINEVNEKNVLVNAKTNAIYFTGTQTAITVNAGTYNGEVGVLMNGKTASINGGNYVGSEYGVHIQKGIVTIGNIEDEVSEYPIIRGNEKALYNEGGTLNIYDGTFKAVDTITTGLISGLPDGYTLKDKPDEIIDGDTYKVKQLLQSDNFVKVGDEEFNSLNKALNEINTNYDGIGTMTLIDNGSLNVELELLASNDVSLDLNGYALMINKQIKNKGIFRISDLSSDESGSMNFFVDNGIYNNKELIINNGNFNSEFNTIIYTGSNSINNMSTLTIEKGNFVINKDASGDFSVITVDSFSNVNMNGGSIYLSGDSVNGSSRNSNAIFVKSNNNTNVNVKNASIEVSGNTESVNYSCAAIGSSSSQIGNVNVQNVDFNASCGRARGIYASRVEVTNSNIKATTGSIRNGYSIGVDSSNYTINGGKIVALSPTVKDYINGFVLSVSGSGTIGGNSVIESEGVCVYFGTVTINSGTFNCELSGVGIERRAYNPEGNITINGGTINAKNDGVYANKVTINGGTINAENRYGVISNSSITIDSTNVMEPTNITGGTYGIYLSAGTATIKKGVITGNNGYGIYSNGTVILGEDDSILNSSPIIKGTTHGLYSNTGKSFKFYDGTLKGQTAAYVGVLSDQASDAIIETVNEIIDGDSYEVKYLTSQTDIVQNTTTNIKYTNLNEAISEVNSGEKLKMIDNASVFEVITNDNDNEVEIDMDGYSIVTTKSLVNNKKMIIKNSNATKESIIITSFNINLINNIGDLELDNINIENNSSGTEIILNNEGILSISDTSVNGVNTLYNIGSTSMEDSIITASNTAINDEGVMDVNSSEIVGGSYGIYSKTSDNGEYRNSKITSNSSAFYKYGESSTQTLIDNEINSGYVYNGDGELLLTGGNLYGYVNNLSSMTIDGVEIVDDSPISSWNVVHKSINNAGNMNVSNINYTINDSHRGNLNVIYNTGTLDLNNNEFNVNRAINYNSCNTLWGCNHYHVNNIYNEGVVNISSDVFKLRDTSGAENPYTEFRGIDNEGNGKFVTKDLNVNVNGGKTAYAIYQASSIIENEIDNVHFNDSDADLINLSLSSENNYGIYVTSGKVNVRTNSINIVGKNGYGLYSDNGTIDIDNINVTGISTNSYGVYANDGSINIRNGSIDVSGENSYGIYVNQEGASVYLGTLHGPGAIADDVSITNPQVKAIGSTLGIGVKRVNGSFNFYDGKLIGSTYAKPETANNVESGFEARYYLVHDDDTETEVSFGDEAGKTYKYEYSILEVLN